VKGNKVVGGERAAVWGRVKRRENPKHKKKKGDGGEYQFSEGCFYLGGEGRGGKAWEKEDWVHRLGRHIEMRERDQLDKGKSWGQKIRFERAVGVT